MKCEYCGQLIKSKKLAIKKEESFEYFMNKVINKAKNKLKKESGYGISDTKGKQWQKR